VSVYAENVLEVLMRLGRTSDVLDRMPALVAGPGYFTRARLRIDPVYASLRGNPRFEAIVAERP
jgi:hypothetical protein